MVDGDMASDCKASAEETVDAVESEATPANTLDFSLGIYLEALTRRQYRCSSVDPAVQCSWEN